MRPIDAVTVGDQEFLITWEDGHRSLYNFVSLRLQCPCAGCSDEWTGKRLIDPAKISQNIKLQAYDPVGRYAFRFRWSDGHQTGIYGFQFLRQICPCGACAPAVKKENKI